jgi:tellurite resistance protein TerC
VHYGLSAWVLFLAFVLGMLALDLGVFHRNAHAVRVREAAIWSGVWVALALLFCGGLYRYAGPEPALQFLTGYLVEKSLAVDNIFVIVIIFAYFSVPLKYQHRVLFWGVLGALLMRGGFIGLGAYVLQHWHWVMYVFGAVLLVSGVKLAVHGPEEDSLEKNVILRLSRRFLPLTLRYHGHHFWVREAGRVLATPLFVVLLVVEFSDLVFALDSIPAIFAITQDPFIVFTSNVFAILGLRSMYFLLAGVIHRFVYLRHALALVLVFIGLKMVLVDVVHISTPLSLVVVATLLAGGVLFSLRASRVAPLEPSLPERAPEPLDSVHPIA